MMRALGCTAARRRPAYMLIACLAWLAVGPAQAAQPSGPVATALPAGVYDLNGTLNFAVDVEDRDGNDMTFDVSADVVHDERGRLTSASATVSNVFYAPAGGTLPGSLACTAKGTLRAKRTPGADWTRIKGVFDCAGTLFDGGTPLPTTATLKLDTRYDATTNTRRDRNRVKGRLGSLKGSLKSDDTLAGPPPFLPPADDVVVGFDNVAVDAKGHFLSDGDLQVDGVGGSQTYDVSNKGVYKSATDRSKVSSKGAGGARVVLRDLLVTGGSGVSGSYTLKLLGHTAKGELP